MLQHRQLVLKESEQCDGLDDGLGGRHDPETRLPGLDGEMDEDEDNGEWVLDGEMDEDDEWAVDARAAADQVMFGDA